MDARHESPRRNASAVRSTASAYSFIAKRLTRLLTASNFEPKELNLLEECAHIYPGRQWSELSTREQTDVIRTALHPQHWLIDPHCDYMKYWDLVLSVALLFTGVVTPYEVIFVGTVTWDSWLFLVNRIVDMIFVKDMVMQFFLKVETGNTALTGSVLLKDPWKIRKRYLTRWFVIDFISIMPFDVFFMFYTGPSALSQVKFLRCLRLIRLVKLVRILKSSRLIQRWQNFFAISFSTQKLAKFTFILILSSHWMACLWGIVGISFGYELCDNRGSLIEYEEEPVSQVSWVTTLYNADNGGTMSPDDPCKPWHVYMASLHWSVMTITSIGYGDITPVRNEEYVTCIFCMLFGGILWAYIIGSTCSLIANGNPVEANFETNADLLNHMMTEARVPPWQRSLFRGYLREAKTRDTLLQFREVANRFSPVLKGQLLMHVSEHWIEKIYYLRLAPAQCLMEIAGSVDTEFLSRKEMLVGMSDKMCALDRGTLAQGGHIMTPGSVFQLDFIVSEQRWRSRPRAVSLTYSLVLVLDRERFFAIIEPFPEVKAVVARAAVRYAMSQVMHRCAAAHRRMLRSDHLATSLVSVFELLQADDGAAAYAGREMSRTQSMGKRASIAYVESLSFAPRSTNELSLPGRAEAVVGEVLQRRLADGAERLKAQVEEVQRQLDHLGLVRQEAAFERRSKSLANSPTHPGFSCDIIPI